MTNSDESEDDTAIIDSLPQELREQFATLGLLRNVRTNSIRRVERLCQLRELEDGHLLCRKGATSTRLYFLLSGHVTSSGGVGERTSIKTKLAGTFLPDAEFFANMAIRFDDLHKKVMLPTTIREDWRCGTRMQVLEIKFQPFLALVCVWVLGFRV